jgi:hypothetical protein
MRSEYVSQGVALKWTALGWSLRRTTEKRMWKNKKCIKKNECKILKASSMKKRKLFLVMWFLATFLGACFAQDVIVTKDARKISAKITEVNIDNIKYKSFDNQDGPTYTLLKSAVSSIRYQNGTEETFGEEKNSSEPAPAPDPAYGAQSAQQQGEMQDDDK